MMFCIAVTATVMGVIIAVSHAIVAVFIYMLAKHKTNADKEAKKQEKIEEAKKLVEDACDNGSLSDLIDAAKQIGEAKK